MAYQTAPQKLIRYTLLQIITSVPNADNFDSLTKPKRSRVER